MSDNELIQKAIEMRLKALAPYSNYKVGAAILTESGKIFGGCNIENSSYSLTICCLLYTSPSPRDRQKSRMPSSA